MTQKFEFIATRTLEKPVLKSSTTYTRIDTVDTQPKNVFLRSTSDEKVTEVSQLETTAPSVVLSQTKQEVVAVESSTVSKNSDKVDAGEVKRFEDVFSEYRSEKSNLVSTRTRLSDKFKRWQKDESQFYESFELLNKNDAPVNSAGAADADMNSAEFLGGSQDSLSNSELTSTDFDRIVKENENVSLAADQQGLTELSSFLDSLEMNNSIALVDSYDWDSALDLDDYDVRNSNRKLSDELSARTIPCDTKSGSPRRTAGELPIKLEPRRSHAVLPSESGDQLSVQAGPYDPVLVQMEPHDRNNDFQSSVGDDMSLMMPDVVRDDLPSRFSGALFTGREQRVEHVDLPSIPSQELQFESFSEAFEAEDEYKLQEKNPSKENVLRVNYADEVDDQVHFSNGGGDNEHINHEEAEISFEGEAVPYRELELVQDNSEIVTSSLPGLPKPLIDNHDSNEELTIQPHLMAYEEQLRMMKRDAVDLEQELELTINSRELETVDEIVVETKVTEVKTVFMHLSESGDISVTETTEVKTDTDLKETKKVIERDEVIMSHRTLDKKQHDSASLGSLSPVSSVRSKLSDTLPPSSSSKFADLKSDVFFPDVTPESLQVPLDSVIQESAKMSVLRAGKAVEAGLFIAKCPYEPESDDVMSLHEGEYLETLDEMVAEDWCLVKKVFDGREGYVPAQYLRDKSSNDKMIEEEIAVQVEKLSPVSSKTNVANINFATCRTSCSN